MVPATITILSDNCSHDTDLLSVWSFSCLINIGTITVLFDTGSDADTLFHNSRHLGIDLSTIDAIVISHNHWDHTGGLADILEVCKGPKLYLPQSFTDRFKSAAEQLGAQIVEISLSMEIASGVLSTGEMGQTIIEQAVVVTGERGPILITGCAHPGVVEVANQASKLVNTPPELIMGGFHLRHKSPRICRNIAVELKEMGVKRVAPSHCTGDNARAAFAEVFGDGYLCAGVGSVVE